MPEPLEDFDLTLESAVTSAPPDEGLLWAVSYSDLLMVLMTFFIVFFEFSHQVLPGRIHRIIVSLQNEGVSAVDNPRVPANQAPAGAGIQWRPLFRGLPIATPARDSTQPVPREDGLVVHLSDNLYASAEFDLNQRAQSELRQVLELIRPHADHLFVSFIGHTDEAPVIRLGSSVIDSNLVLSTLRGAKAMEFAVKQGFNPRWLASQGVAEYARNTRSLSVQIMEREDR